MIGPGTGVAPFRGFVQERAAIGRARPQLAVLRQPALPQRFPLPARMAAGAEAAARCTGSTSPSRATRRDKVYVQQRLREHGPRAVYAWLEGGAHLYVCGDATRMARGRARGAARRRSPTHGGRRRRGRARTTSTTLQRAGPLRSGTCTDGARMSTHSVEDIKARQRAACAARCWRASPIRSPARCATTTRR